MQYASAGCDGSSMRCVDVRVRLHRQGRDGGGRERRARTLLSLGPRRLPETERPEHGRVERERAGEIAAHEVDVAEPDEHALIRSHAPLRGSCQGGNPGRNLVQSGKTMRVRTI